MEIIKNELKKIFNIKSLLVLLGISFVIYKIFIDFHIETFPNGRPDGDVYEIAKDFVEEKGINASEEGIEYFIKLKEKYEEESDNYLLNDPLARELGISSYKELKDAAYRKTDNDAKVKELNNKIMFEEYVDSFWKVQASDYFVNMYEVNNDYNASKEQIERINEIINNKSYRDVFPEVVLNNYNSFIFNSMTLIIVSIIFLLAPIFTKDRQRNLEQIQYATKRGRKLYKDKIITALIASAIIVTIELGILFFMYLTRENTVEVFYNASINSWFNFGYYWFDLTFKEYIIVTIIFVYIFALCLVMLITFISRKCCRYITLIGISLLLSIGLINLVTLETLLWKGLGWINRPKFLITTILFVFASLVALLIYIQNKKEKKRSILN